LAEQQLVGTFSANQLMLWHIKMHWLGDFLCQHNFSGSTKKQLISKFAGEQHNVRG